MRTSPSGAALLAHRIIRAFGSDFEIDSHHISVGTSIGIALPPGDGTLPERLLKNADIALYLAKTEGRGTARFFEPEMDARIQLRRMLELDLRGAIARNEFELVYQPTDDLRVHRISGFETLLQWHHPVGGPIELVEFIPLAEETGLIVSIGEWVLRTACSDAVNWAGNIRVAVNLSPGQFQKGDVVAAVTAALEASGLLPSRLELEITEAVVLRNNEKTLSALRQLRDMGVSIALDDFGTGYSSLSYLRSFPFDRIKIDQSFVRDLVDNQDSLSIVRAIVGLGKSLRMQKDSGGCRNIGAIAGTPGGGMLRGPRLSVQSP
jgi:predicted signal transduction protein with EAL and GGDEF domain